MRTQINIPATLGSRYVEHALEGLARIATDQLASGELPPLYESGVRYRREQGTEDWLTPAELVTAGSGDCEDLAAYRVGELRATGEDPTARVVVVRTGPRTLHAVVQRGDGRLEDPSRRLGMPGRGDGVALPRMLVGVEPEHTWTEIRRRSPRGTLLSGSHLAEALGNTELGVVPINPIIDMVSRVAQGVVSSVVPGQGPASLPKSMPAARQTSAMLREGGVDVSPGEVLQIATQLARVVRAEAQRMSRSRRGAW